ncbi:hypothetical protein [Reichenbachiella ulvae]|uniref:Cadherin domain-containing protein n=1 Tax=Reichenbachiella ulvae TaxID=2980104 RepID=A0ABT3CTX1_9BACT|nr:hypothetical protein [Reichenbachiella ulvae]MCV9387031.1 hypothetical protein [Reichenbachiella ulvae]
MSKLRIILFVPIYLLSHIVFGQANDSLRLIIDQNFIEVDRGAVITFSVEKSQKHGQIKMVKAPKQARFDGKTFSWAVPEYYDKGNEVISFQYMDDDRLLDAQSIFIIVHQLHTPPKIQVKSNAVLKNGVYRINPTFDFHLEAHASTVYSTDSSDVMLDYYFNDNPDLKEIDQVDIDLRQNSIDIVWTPNRDQIKEKYFRLTLKATDAAGGESTEVLVFALSSNNHIPYFKFPVLDEYYITDGEQLSIDLSADDLDHDSLLYRLVIPSKIGNPRLSEKGLFTWKVNNDELHRLRSYFPMEVTVEVTEKGPENPNTISKTFLIRKSIRNEPPKILNLQNEHIREGITLNKKVFIQDGNDQFSELEIDIIGAPEDMVWHFENNLLSIQWTPGFDVVGVEMQPKKFDMLLVVRDPHGYVDQRAFTITVEHRENTVVTYETYMQYRNDAVHLVEYLSQIHNQMEDREDKGQRMKKGLSVATIFFSVYTASGNVFDDGSAAKELVPFVGIMAAIAGGVNAFGFNDLNKYGSLREQTFIMQQKLMYILALLNEYKIEGPNSPNLENKEFRDNLSTYEQWMVQDKLNFKSYYSRYKTLNYVKKATQKARRKAMEEGREPEGLLFLDLTKI